MWILCLRITLIREKPLIKAPSALSNAMKGEKSLGAIFIRKKQDTNKRYIKNLSNLERTQAQMKLLVRGPKFIPTPVTNETHIRTQLPNDFKAFVWRMLLQYISYGQDKEPHSFHVKSNRPFPNYLWPLFQSESWCSSFHMKISFHSHANEN